MAAGPADKVLDVFKELVFDQLVKNIIAKIVGLAPFLAWGPIAFIVTKVVTYLAGMVYDELKDAVNMKYIMLKNERYHAEFVAANGELRDIAKTKGIDSPEFKEAREKRKKTLADLARYDATR